MNQTSIRYRHMVWLFAKIGASSFGGWSAAAVQMEKELVTRRKLITLETLQGAVAYAQMLPGATQVSIVAHAGYRMRGVKGALLATISYLLLPITLAFGFAVVYFRFLQQSPQLMNRLDGVIAALCGVILANAFRIGIQHAKQFWMWGMVGAALFARLQFNLSPLLIIGIFASGGLITALMTAPAAPHAMEAVAVAVAEDSDGHEVDQRMDQS